MIFRLILSALCVMAASAASAQEYLNQPSIRGFQYSLGNDDRRNKTSVSGFGIGFFVPFGSGGVDFEIADTNNNDVGQAITDVRYIAVLSQGTSAAVEASLGALFVENNSGGTASVARDIVAGLSFELALGSSTLLALNADYYDVENAGTLGGTFAQFFGGDTDFIIDATQYNDWTGGDFAIIKTGLIFSF